MTNGYVLGGEQSGHVIFSKHATTGDGILTALIVNFLKINSRWLPGLILGVIGAKEVHDFLK